MTNDPEAPADASLQETTDRLDAEGWAGQFQAVAGGDIRCLSCRQAFPASSGHADDVIRLEGISDPADMVIVIPLRCPHCDTAGTLIATYGPEAGEAEVDVLAALQRVPSEGKKGIGNP